MGVALSHKQSLSHNNLFIFEKGPFYLIFYFPLFLGQGFCNLDGVSFPRRSAEVVSVPEAHPFRGAGRTDVILMLSMDKLFSMPLSYYLVESFSIWDHQNHETANSIRINALVSLQCFFTNDVDQLNCRGLYLHAQFVCPVPVFRLSFDST